MKKWNKLIAVTMASLMCLSIMAGCASDEKKTDDVSSSQENSAPATNPNKKSLSGKVVYWAMWNETEPQAEAIKYAIDLFNKDYPDVKVEVQWIGRSNTQTVGPAIQAGEKVDIFDNVPYITDPTIFANIDQLYSETAYGKDALFKDTLIKGAVIGDVMQAEAAGLKDGMYGVPVNPFVGGFFYNKELFAQAGITNTPQTWSEFLEVCQKLKDAGIAPITVDDAYMNLMYSYYMSRLVGQETIMQMVEDPKASAWTDGALMTVLEKMEEFATKGYYSNTIATNKYPAGQQEFALGEAAMYLNATWFPGEVADTAGPDFQWGQFSFPTVDGGKEPITAVVLSPISMCVSAKSDNKEASMELLKYIASVPVQQKLSELGFVPATAGTQWPATIADMGPIADSATEVYAFNANFASDFINGAVAPEFTKVMTGKTTAKAAYDAIIAQASKY